MQDKFEYDIDGLFEDLVKSAIKANLAHEFVPNMRSWKFGIADHFFNNGNERLAIQLLHTAHNQDPSDVYVVVKWASFLRKAGQPERAVVVFREHRNRRERGFYCEWGTAEGNVGNHALSVCLAAISLADGITEAPIDNDQAKMSLAGMGVALRELYGKYHDRVFVEALGAVAELGQLLTLDEQTRKYFAKHGSESRAAGVKLGNINACVQLLEAAVIAAWQRREQELSESILGPEKISLTDLTKLAIAGAKKRQRRS